MRTIENVDVLVKNLGQGIKNVKINDLKTYNSLSKRNSCCTFPASILP